MRTTIAFTAAALLLALAAPDTSLAARPCPVVDEDARAAQKAGDLEQLLVFYREAHGLDSGCDNLYLADFGRDVALAHIDRFNVLYQQDGDAARHKHFLDEARRYGEPWQLLVILGGVEAESGNHELAASFFQQAVHDLQIASRSVAGDSGAAANLPTASEFELIYSQMAESALLAHTFSPPAASRGEESGGLFTESYRGYTVKSVPVPVQFQFDSTRFTSKGEKVAAYLLDYLKGGNLTKIKLIGHTDPKGADTYNLGLSVRRAEAVRDFLKDGGYGGEILVEGRGESEPFKPVDPERFANDIDAKHQLDRRVELVRNPDG